MNTFKIKSKGYTGEEYVTYLEKKKYHVSNWVKDVSTQVSQTKKRGYITPPAEIGFLLREYFSGKDLEKMGLWWLVVMHEAITDSDGDPNLLGLNRDDDGRWLDAYFGNAVNRWDPGDGFVFRAPQVSALGTSESELLEPKNLALPRELVINGITYIQK